MKRLFLYAALLLLTQCSKCKDDPQPKTEEEKLPPATQEGKNTFGCLVNGTAFTPQGGSRLSQNPAGEYDPDFNGGTFSLSAYREIGAARESMVFELIPVTGPGTFAFTQQGGFLNIVGYVNYTFPGVCASPYTYQNMTYQRGSFTLTRLDVTQRIAAGTFEVTFARPGCDTIKLTQGRFDVRF